MTRDLEETLAEMGEEYRPVVDRLIAAYEPSPDRSVLFRLGRILCGPAAGFVAASLLVLAGVSALFRGGGVPQTESSAAPVAGANEYALAGRGDEASLEEIIRTQNADGSWKNDFLTRQNAQALRLSDAPAARVAYKKALRNLRVRAML